MLLLLRDGVLVVFIRVMVFQKGELKEIDSPHTLRNNPESIFADMAKHDPGLKAVAAASSDSDEECATSNALDDRPVVQPNEFLH